MSPELAANFDKLDARMETMIAKIEGFSPEVLAVPVGKSLAPGLVLEHMLLSEKGYEAMANPAQFTKFKGKTPKPSFIYRMILKQMAKPASMATPMPAPFVPKGSVDSSAAGKEWRKSRANLRTFLAELDDDACCGGNLVMGRLSPSTVHDLLSAHQDYHDARLP